MGVFSFFNKEKKQELDKGVEKTKEARFFYVYQESLQEKRLLTTKCLIHWKRCSFLPMSE